MKTFMMATTEGHIEKGVVAEFEMYGETWVVHSKDGAFSVSHPGTGWGISGTSAFDVETSMGLGKKRLSEIGEEKVKSAIAKVKKEKK